MARVESYLFLDTETTGLPPTAVPTRGNFHQWPRMMAVAWQEVSADGAIIDQQRYVVELGHVQTSIPGIPLHLWGKDPDEKVSSRVAVEKAVAAINTASTVVGHNLRFDLGIIQSERLRLGFLSPFPRSRTQLLCTIDLAARTRLVRKRYGLSGRIPLNRLYKALFQHELRDHHDPLADADACRQIYFALQDMK